MAARSSFFEKVLGRLDRLDAGELRQVLRRLAQEHSFFETLLDAIGDGVAVVDRDGRLAYYNPAAARLLGIPPESGEGEPLRRFLPALDLDGLLEGAKGPHRVVQQELEVSYPCPRFLRVVVAALDQQAAAGGGLVLVLHDVTEARRKTFETVESERSHAIGLLAASVAHEIGNPLNAIHIHFQLIERELKRLAGELPPPEGEENRPPLPPRFEERLRQFLEKVGRYLEVAKGEILRLDTILTDFLQSMRRTPPRIQPASMNELVEETLRLLGPQLRDRGLAVEVDLAQGLPSCAMDPKQMKQALLNLVKNSMQAMTRGGRLALRTGKSGDGVWVSVEDTGGGIRQEHLARIFEPFYTTKKKGVGLGLMVVQRIVRDHGGKIEVESRVGEGTVFRIWLPAAERAPRLLEAGAGEEKAQ